MALVTEFFTLPPVTVSAEYRFALSSVVSTYTYAVHASVDHRLLMISPEDEPRTRASVQLFTGDDGAGARAGANLRFDHR